MSGMNARDAMILIRKTRHTAITFISKNENAPEKYWIQRGMGALEM